MPEYLAPGVYVEEVSFRSKSIEAVSTSTTGMAGFTRYGPTNYPAGPSDYEPRLVTSFTEFERVFGGLEAFRSAGSDIDGRIPYLAHAARAFFLNGGQRLYVSRVFADNTTDDGVASLTVPLPSGTARWGARWPGSYGNVPMRLSFVRNRSFIPDRTVTAAQRYSVVEIIPGGGPVPGDDVAPVAGQLAVIDLDEATSTNIYRTDDAGGTTTPGPTDVVHIIELQVLVQATPDRVDDYQALGAHPTHKRYAGRILALNQPADPDAVIWFDDSGMPGPVAGALELVGVASAPRPAPLDAGDDRLINGNDGNIPSPDDLLGREADPDNPDLAATGLEALGEIEDIAIVAAPDAAVYDNEAERTTATGHLIGHAERDRFRIAVVDGPAQQSLNQIRDFRGQFDTTYAALYHPWIEILDPLDLGDPGTPPRRLLVPPSGFVTGVYARTDVQRGVHKAPANETVTGLTRFEVNINKRRQDVLNPEGINALRFFEGRGRRIWGARTMSSDPEWKYVNVRRLLIMIEHSIYRSTQWAVFEPNNHRLWGNIRRTVEDFLLVLWRDGALLGATPEDAFFVRCDRTTMTQNDLDNGRLICLIGVAPTKPAEYVIFRIGQWTADANN